MTDLHRNGYATVSDLDSPELQITLGELERYQLEFVAAVSSIWAINFPFTGDSLYGWSRQWEYPYHLANIGSRQGCILDAGSGITFFPFYLARQGYKVHCCDHWAILEDPFKEAKAQTGLAVEFKCASITQISHPDGFFDAVCCVSVLEHLLNGERRAAIREFARVLRAGGRLIVTCDVSLGRDSSITIEEFAVLVQDLLSLFKPVYPLEMLRPPNLLTTDYFRASAPWRLPWRTYRRNLHNLLRLRAGKSEFASLAVFGLTLVKPE